MLNYVLQNTTETNLTIQTLKIALCLLTISTAAYLVICKQ